MDHHHHHHQHQWHLRPPSLPPPHQAQPNNICPICSIYHFPFCPPPPPPPHPSYAHQSPRFPSPPGYPWQGLSPNFDRQNPLRPVYDYYGGGNAFASERDRNCNKRMRIDENNPRISSDDERRLKLIRDHGGSSRDAAFLDRNGLYSVENDVANNSVNDWQSYGPNNQPPPPPPPPPSTKQGWHHHQNYCNGSGNMDLLGGYLSHYPSNSVGQPPLPTSPPPPLPVEPPLPLPSDFKAYLTPLPPPPQQKVSLFPVPVDVPSSYPAIPNSSTEFIAKEPRTLPMQYLGESQSFPLKQSSPEKPKVVDALHLFKKPHRATRPDHFVIILRGLPGSGKSYLAKMLRDLEVESGGDAPRIHSMDDYFMAEVEKVEEADVSKSLSTTRSKKPITKKVMEYCYEPEMEEAYRSSMLKAFKRTLEEGSFTFVIVDDRNLRVADFAQFWAFAKRSGYEVYILEATYKDPAGCAARNVHGCTLDDIEKMAEQWEEAPCLYLQLDIKSLFHGDDLKGSGIKEVDMDMEEEDFDGSVQQEKEPSNTTVSITENDAPTDSTKDGKRWDAEGDNKTKVVKDLGRSKWSDDLDEVDAEQSEVMKGNLSALSGLFQAYGKESKCVRWGDQGGDTGFSIVAAKKANVLSLVIGPGAGYNLKSNPLREAESPVSIHSVVKKKQNKFQECLRAERESFKAVFDKRRQRIGGLEVEEEQS